MKYIFLTVLCSSFYFGQVQKEQLNLMPWPKEISLNSGKFSLNKEFKINIQGVKSERLTNATTKFLRRLDGRTGVFFTQGFAYNGDEKSAALQINVKNIATLNLQQDESYQLSVSPKAITINANTDSGAIYALETLLQSLQNTNSEYFFPALSVTDNPRFKWRGLMIDAARHFQPVDVIKRNLDAMAAVKLNVFHWHLVDDQGWRIEMKNLKQLHEKASDGQYYSQEQIKDVVKYANNLGIMVMPEIDVPGHASAILTAIPEIGSTVGKSYSIERNAGVFTPTLDPTNPKTYQILSQIFDEVCPLFPGKYFHIGGDENEGKEWDANPKIQQFKKENNLKTNHDLQTYFTLKLNLMLKKNNKILMGWEEIMTKDMSKDAIIHAWREGSDDSKTGGSVVKAAENGYQTVLSNGFYIDLLLGVNHHYETDPINSKLNLSPSIQKNILGGEATMWSELVSPLTIDSRIWPRTAAIAERLWSEATVNNLENLYKRLTPVSNRLEELGISHIKNKEQILRNISNYQDTQALEDFSNICEPLKYYSRNKGGTEYQSYSPLTLFADACTPDAKDALLFNQYVKKYSENPSDTVSKKTIIDFLNKWISTDENLKKLNVNAPLVVSFLPLSSSLSNLSKQLVYKLEGNPTYNPALSVELLEKCKSKDFADVELAVVSGLQNLIQNKN